MEMGTTTWPGNNSTTTTAAMPQAQVQAPTPATIHPLQTRSDSLPVSPHPHSLSASLRRSSASSAGSGGGGDSRGFNTGNNNNHHVLQQPIPGNRALVCLDDLRSLDDRLNLTGLVERIGNWPAKSGGFSDVWEGRFEKRKVAIKVMREVGTQRGTLTRRLIRETRAWSKLYHRNVLPLLGFAYGCGSDTLASLVSPWAPGGTAPAYLRDKSLSERFKTITEVADGLSYLHRHDVVHGDLKGDNILIGERGEAQLADFGLSKLVSEVSNAAHQQSKTTSVVGSVRWMARELFLSDSQTASCVNKDTDVWSYGMTVLELFTDRMPYCDERNDFSVVILVHHGKLPHYPEDAPCAFPFELWELCNECWHDSPSLRPSMRLIARRMWELELRCKRVEKRRTDTRPSESSDADENPRVRKSPKLALLPELVEEFSYPAPSLPDPYILARSPTASSPSSHSTTNMPTTTFRTSSPRNGEFTLAHFQQGHPVPDFEFLPPWRPNRTVNTRTLSMPTTPRQRLLQIHSPHSEPNYQNALGHAHSESTLTLDRYHPYSYVPSPLGLSGVSGQSHSRSTSLSGSLDYSFAQDSQDPRTDPLSYAHIDSSASAYLECFPGSNMSQHQPRSSSALSLRHDHLASANNSYSPMQTPTDLQYPQDKLHLPMFSDSLIFSNYLAEEPAEVYHDRYGSSSQTQIESHVYPPPSMSSSSSSLTSSSSSSQSSLLTRHDELPPSFTEMRHGLFSPAMSDVTPLLGSLDTFPPSASSLTDSFGPWDSGDFGDFEDLEDDPYDEGLALFGGVAIDENVSVNDDQGHGHTSVGAGSGSINGNGMTNAVGTGNQNPITPMATPRSSPTICTLSELHSRTPTTPTAGSNPVRSPPRVASEA